MPDGRVIKLYKNPIELLTRRGLTTLQKLEE